MPASTTTPMPPTLGERPEPARPALVDRAPGAARWTFVVLLVVAAALYAVLGRSQWFFGDEWAFLATRDAGSLRGLFAPHNEHWVTLPIIAYRLMWTILGLHSYKPYQAMSIGLHLVTATLVRTVMRRLGVSPWVATTVTAVFLFYGSGSENIVWAFQISFTGAVSFGLGQLLLADHPNPSRRRVGAGLACGLGALMCSGIGLVMVATVGLAVLIRRGWRAALLNTAPLIAVYGLWWSIYGHEAQRQPTGSASQVFDFVVTGLRAVGASAGQNALSISAMVVVTGIGLGLRAWSVGRSPARLRRQLGVPTALAAGVVAVFLATGLTRVALFGPSFATSGRYRYVAVALLAPILAVGADAVVHRWRIVTAPILLLLVAGVPANVAAIQTKRDPKVSPAIVLAVANWPAITRVPASTMPFPERKVTALITAGWLRYLQAAGAGSPRGPANSAHPSGQCLPRPLHGGALAWSPSSYRFRHHLQSPPMDPLAPASPYPERSGELAAIYATRFGARSAERVRLWETLVDGYFQQFIGPTDTVLDLAAGYCEFTNAVRCGRKIAVDLNPTITSVAGPDVEVFHSPSTDLDASLTDQVDVAWVSNFFEHLADSAELLATLRELHRVLRPGGRLLVLQPNIRLTGAAYWDFVDHSLAITDKSLAEALNLTGFRIETMKVRFLPYTTESRLPISPSLIRLYLKVPLAQFLLGQQTFVVARAC